MSQAREVSDSITQWLGRLRAGDADAARLLWERYSRKLRAMARRKLPPGLRRVTDEDDIAQSVFAALFEGADVGRLERLANRDELWWFLLAATRHKIVDHVRSAGARKRGGEGAQNLSEAGTGPLSGQRRFHEIVSDEPTPEFVATLEDEQRRLLGLLRDDQLRDIAARRIEGYSVEEIAARLGISPRSVTRKLALIRNTWANEVER
jgi:RNA polymerase sigma factor (sigma-70 family)